MPKDPPPSLIVDTDGAARGNPGPAGIGIVLLSPEGEALTWIGRGIGEATNNVAEYRAAIEGLKMAAEVGARAVLLRTDSRLLVEQLSGRYRVRAKHLVDLHREAKELVGSFEKVTFKHIPRTRNVLADRMANKGIDEWLAGKGNARKAPKKPPEPEPEIIILPREPPEEPEDGWT